MFRPLEHVIKLKATEFSQLLHTYIRLIYNELHCCSIQSEYLVDFMYCTCIRYVQNTQVIEQKFNQIQMKRDKLSFTCVFVGIFFQIHTCIRLLTA